MLSFNDVSSIGSFLRRNVHKQTNNLVNRVASTVSLLPILPLGALGEFFVLSERTEMPRAAWPYLPQGREGLSLFLWAEPSFLSVSF